MGSYLELVGMEEKVMEVASCPNTAPEPPSDLTQTRGPADSANGRLDDNPSGLLKPSQTAAALDPSGQPPARTERHSLRCVPSAITQLHLTMRKH